MGFLSSNQVATILPNHTNKITLVYQSQVNERLSMVASLQG